MSGYLSKANFNRKAAEMLFNNEIYCSTIHCSYYQCVQIMAHIMNHILNYEKGNYDLQTKADEKSTHKFIIDHIFSNIRKKIENAPRLKHQELKASLREFSKINELKVLRVKSDYSEAEILQEQSQLSISYASRITKALNKFYTYE